MNRSLTRFSRNFSGLIAAAALLAAPMIGLASSTSYAEELDALPDLNSSQCSGNLKFGSKGECVKSLQTRLNTYGFKLGVDGDFGPGTVEALVNFQFVRPGLDADGVAGPATKKALYGPSVTAPKPKKLKGAEFRKEVVRVSEAVIAKNMEYAWAGGHDVNPAGPSIGSCKKGYSGPTPCTADQISSFDCSGFARYVTYMAGYEVDGVTGEQLAKGKRLSQSQAEPGDLVFFGSEGAVHHVAVYAGKDKDGKAWVYEAPQSWSKLAKRPLSSHSKPLAFARYNG